MTQQTKHTDNEAAKAVHMPTKLPVMCALPGVYYDFNAGARVAVDAHAQRSYYVTIVDKDAQAILYAGTVKPGSCIRTRQLYYCRMCISVYNTDTPKEHPLFQHTLDLCNMPVLVRFLGSAIGDNIGWFSYIQRFYQKHKPKLTVVMCPAIAQLVRAQYQHINIITEQQAQYYASTAYATYNIGLFFNEGQAKQPYDFRYTGLHRAAAYILGLRSPQQLQDIPPVLDLTAQRQIHQKYAVIAVQASSRAKLWNNPCGWAHVIRYLKQRGYRVLCVDKSACTAYGYVSNSIPYGCEDFTGNIALQQRVDLIKDADLFIGLSSGLSWLAWCCGVPVVLISGFTDPYNQFYTPYRIQNTHVCHGCWHNTQQPFSHTDYLWCPRKDTQKQKFQCTRQISAAQVTQAIDNIIEQKQDNTNNKAQQL